MCDMAKHIATTNARTIRSIGLFLKKCVEKAVMVTGMIVREDALVCAILGHQMPGRWQQHGIAVVCKKRLDLYFALGFK